VRMNDLAPGFHRHCDPPAFGLARITQVRSDHAVRSVDWPSRSPATM
jgi:hypothetical protein